MLKWDLADVGEDDSKKKKFRKILLYSKKCISLLTNIESNKESKKNGKHYMINRYKLLHHQP